MSKDATIADVLEGRARWACVLADCLDVLPALGDGCIGVTLTDPPFSKALYSRTRTNKGTGLRPNGKPVSRAERVEDPNRSAARLASMAIGAIDDILVPVAAELLRVTTRWVLAFHDCEIGDRWRDAFGARYIRTGAWVKANPMPQVTGDRPAAGFEPCTIAHARPGRMRWNGGGRAAVWTHPNSQGAERPAHPCPKPFGLMLDLVDDFTDADEIVLDPFCGSATTGAAALRRGRKFIGIERNAEFHAEAVARLSGLLTTAPTPQTSIFDVLGTPTRRPKRANMTIVDCALCGGNRETCGHFTGAGAL
jgi:site-specific DNA-methyltransferase (adenine-specific)